VQPIVIWTDTVWINVVDFYPEYSSNVTCTETLRDAVAQRASGAFARVLAIYWSNWAAQSAIRYYGLDPSKVRVVPPGPAFDDKDAVGLDDAKHLVRARGRDRCRLLFVGIDWVRKGGDTALEVAKLFNASGLATTELVVVGCEPQVDEPLPKFVRVIGHLSRSSEEGAAKLKQLYETSHFLIVPTRGEAFGLVFAEANAFALPSLATNVGGISEIVTRCGYAISSLLPAVKMWRKWRDFPIIRCANRVLYIHVANLMQHYNEYEELALSALREFRARLNNRTAADSVLSLMADLL
jgi:glycosyltransferase involved in cell wall biosynthesis